MRIGNSVLIGVLTAAFTASSVVGDPVFGATHSTSTESRTRDGKAGNPPTLDCTKSKSDPRCGHPHRPAYPPARPYYPPQSPHYHPQPYRPRPVIINQLPEEPAIEINSLTDDWEGCRKAKLGAIKARHSGNSSDANDLDEWLWKNCRSYSYELRQLEQDDM